MKLLWYQKVVVPVLIVEVLHLRNVVVFDLGRRKINAEVKTAEVFQVG